MSDLRDHICGRHHKPFRECGCLAKLAKGLHVWRDPAPAPMREKILLKRPCLNCGWKWTTDPGCTLFCSCACQVIYNAPRS